MGKLTPATQGFLKVLLRSKNIGDGWRQVSEIVWPLAIKAAEESSAIFELDPENFRIRLSAEGDIVAKYL
jgi:hypothetical protein